MRDGVADRVMPHRPRFEECDMARRPNYGVERRQKELKKQKKQEEKAEKKRLRREAATADPDAPEDEADVEEEE